MKEKLFWIQHALYSRAGEIGHSDKSSSRQMAMAGKAMQPATISIDYYACQALLGPWRYSYITCQDDAPQSSIHIQGCGRTYFTFWKWNKIKAVSKYLPMSGPAWR